MAERDKVNKDYIIYTLAQANEWGFGTIEDLYNYLVNILAISGGGQIAFTKTKAEIDTLIAGNDLEANALYEITGVHPTLYDDGTTSGTTVYLRAINSNTLEVQGMGKFYNPKYNQSVDGFGIWDNKTYGTFSNIVGVFDYQNKEAITANNAATGIILADGMIQWVSGDWSTATSITGDVSGATADVADFVSPSYGVGDKVIWGGYSWTNVNGNIGASVDVLNLDAEWTKNVYDTTNYNIAYDLIEYDYVNDMIIRRYEKECVIPKFTVFQTSFSDQDNFYLYVTEDTTFDLSTLNGARYYYADGSYIEEVGTDGLVTGFLGDDITQESTVYRYGVEYTVKVGSNNRPYISERMNQKIKYQIDGPRGKAGRAVVV